MKECALNASHVSGNVQATEMCESVPRKNLGSFYAYANGKVWEDFGPTAYCSEQIGKHVTSDWYDIIIYGDEFIIVM